MKPTKSSMTRKLDKICSEIIRSAGHCKQCGLGDYEKLQCAHIYTRKWRSVRWALNNLICLCASCHSRFHDKPIEFGEFVRGYLGELGYVNLKVQANSIKKWTLAEMQELYQELVKESQNVI